MLDVTIFDGAWRDELVRLGGAIPQDGRAPAGPEEESAAQARVERYLAMVDAFAAAPSEEAAAAVVRSLHPIDDYGIYERSYAALGALPPAAFARVAARELAPWVARHGVAHHSIRSALLRLCGDDAARKAFADAAAAWSSETRRVTVDVLTGWARDDGAWEAVLEAVGAPAPLAGDAEPIPADWPAEWRAATEAFRTSGRVDLAWTPERDLTAHFDRVFAMLELDHGPAWRNVGSLLNIFTRRLREYPLFVAALGGLPPARRERILAHLERSRPDAARRLRGELATLPASGRGE